MTQEPIFPKGKLEDGIDYAMVRWYSHHPHGDITFYSKEQEASGQRPPTETISGEMGKVKGVLGNRGYELYHIMDTEYGKQAFFKKQAEVPVEVDYDIGDDASQKIVRPNAFADMEDNVSYARLKWNEIPAGGNILFYSKDQPKPSLEMLSGSFSSIVDELKYRDYQIYHIEEEYNLKIAYFISRTDSN